MTVFRYFVVECVTQNSLSSNLPRGQNVLLAKWHAIDFCGWPFEAASICSCHAPHYELGPISEMRWQWPSLATADETILICAQSDIRITSCELGESRALVYIGLQIFALIRFIFEILEDPADCKVRHRSVAAH